MTDKPKKKTQVDALKDLLKKLKSFPDHNLANELAIKEEARAISQFEKDYDEWLKVYTIKNEKAYDNIIKVKANKHYKMYDTENGISLVIGSNPIGYEVSNAAKAAGTPRWYLHRYVFSITHNLPLISTSLDIHHINGNPKDNRPRNLLALPAHIHRLYEINCPERLNKVIDKLIIDSGKRA